MRRKQTEAIEWEEEGRKKGKIDPRMEWAAAEKEKKEMNEREGEKGKKRAQLFRLVSLEMLPLDPTIAMSELQSRGSQSHFFPAVGNY